MRVALEVVAILERAGLAFVDVDRHQARRRFRRDDLPLAAGREARAAETAQAGVLHQRDHIGRSPFALHARRRERVSAGGTIGSVVDVARRHGHVGRRMPGRARIDGGLDFFSGRDGNRILTDDRNRGRVAAADARRVQHPHAGPEGVAQGVEQLMRARQLACNRIADANGDGWRRRLALLHHVEVVIKGRDLVDLGQRELHLRGESHQMCG